MAKMAKAKPRKAAPRRAVRGGKAKPKAVKRPAKRSVRRAAPGRASAAGYAPFTSAEEFNAFLTWLGHVSRAAGVAVPPRFMVNAPAGMDGEGGGGGEGGEGGGGDGK